VLAIATWNVNSIRVRLPQVRSWLQAHAPDVLGIQETKATDDQFPAAAFEEIGYYSSFAGQKAYNGVALLSRQPLGGVEAGFFGDPEPAQARVIAGTLASGGVRVVNLYAPNGSEVGSPQYAYKLEWLAAFRRFLDSRHDPSEPLIVLGDFNVAPEDRDVHDPAGWRGHILCSEPEREALRAIKDWGLTDLLRQHEVRGGLYSWWDYRAGSFRRNTGLRIDLILGTAPLVGRSTEVTIDREPRALEQPSDHAPVVARFAAA
jgi:exodeoxyribonuclease-3